MERSLSEYFRVHGLQLCFGQLVERWMGHLSHKHRKKLSSYGGLRRRVASDPRGWSDERKLGKHDSLSVEETFDPGNVIYQWCFRLVLDELWLRYLWNEETCGDIIEAMLGLPVVYPCCLAAVRFASWWDKLCYDTFEFCQASQ